MMGFLSAPAPIGARGPAVLFVDPAGRRPYDDRTLYAQALGTAEAAAVRVAEGLAQRGLRVVVAQGGRHWPTRSAGGVHYVPFRHEESAPRLRAEAVVVLRQHKVLRRLRRAHPEARLALWLRRVPGSRARRLGPETAAARASVVTVSDAHREAVRAFVQERGKGPLATPLARMHDPVGDDLVPDGSRVDPDKLVCFGGPHVDPTEVLAAFARVRRQRPSARLMVMGVARWRGEGPLPEGVAMLGPLPHHAMVRHVREAFCVFSPQTRPLGPMAVRFAEANAVGTPVLAHATGSAEEAVGESARDRRQLLDARDPEAAARRLSGWWTDGRPEVSPPPALRLSRVLDAWERLLGVGARGRQPAPALT